MRDTFRPTNIMVILAAPLLLIIATVQAQSLSRFDLPAQPLADALKAVADQANISVLFDRRQIEGINAPALRAQLTANEALIQLLSGTGLVPRFLNETTVVLASEDHSPVALDGSAQL